jgi:hypothetical protein
VGKGGERKKMSSESSTAGATGAGKRVSSSVFRSKPNLYKTFTKNVNDTFKEDPEDVSGRASKKFNEFCENFVPKAKDGSLEWVLPLDKEIPKHAVVLLAHSVRPMRCIGEITKNEQCSKAIPTNYRYVFEKLIKRDVPREEIVNKNEEDNDSDDHEEDGDGGGGGRGKKNKKTSHKSQQRKRRIETVMVECGKKHQQLISRKKGFWIIWKPSLEAKITIKTLAENMDTVLGWYERYVEGMEKNPSKDFPHKQNDLYIEQFLLNEYPTPEWKKHTKEYQKTNRRYLIVNDGGMLPPPPPPPPPAGDVDGEEEESDNNDDDADEGSDSPKPKKKRNTSKGKGRKKRQTTVNDLTNEIDPLTSVFDAFGDKEDQFAKFMNLFEPKASSSSALNYEQLAFDEEAGDLPNLDDVVSI